MKKTASSTPKRGAKPKFTPAEDKQLQKFVNQLGTNSWHTIAKRMRGKTSKQCHDRWKNYANPQLRNSEWNEEEDLLLIEKFAELGPRWTQIARFFNDRSMNCLRNRFLKLKRAGRIITNQDEDYSINSGNEEEDINSKPDLKSTPKFLQISQLLCSSDEPKKVDLFIHEDGKVNPEIRDVKFLLI